MVFYDIIIQSRKPKKSDLLWLSALERRIKGGITAK